MTYLLADQIDPVPAGERFRALVERPGILRLPGAYNGLSALQAKRAGFDGLYLSGAAMTASMGLPDLGITTVGLDSGAKESLFCLGGSGGGWCAWHSPRT